ncbi:MAG: hypothetical protein RLZZ09_1727, partial [Pseudomonadota bacterium]
MNVNMLPTASRDITRFILRETDSNRLLTGVCRLLVETGGFESALIVLVGHGVTTAPSYQVRCAAGGEIEEGLVAVLSGRLEAGFVPECGRLCLAAEGIHTLTNRSNRCGDCPLKTSYEGTSAYVTRITHEGRILGWLNVALPLAYGQRQEVASHIGEVAVDLACALHNLEVARRSASLDAELGTARQPREETEFARLFYLNPTPMAVADWPGRHFLEANASFLATSGFSREEIIGVDACDFIIFEDDTERDLLCTRLEEGLPIHNFEVCLRRKDGSMLMALISCSQFSFDGRESLLWSLTDITWQKRAEDEARLHEANFRGFFEVMQDMVLVSTREGRVLYANPAVINKLGYDLQELDTGGILSIHPVELQQEALGVFSAMFRGERDTCPLPLQRKDGTLVPVETRVALGKWNGADCIFGIIKDLSPAQEAQQRFERLFRHNPTLMALSSLPDRCFVDVNEAFLVTLGYTRDEIIGNTSTQLGLFVDPDQQAMVTEQLAIGGRVNELEVQVRGRDGRVLDGLFSGELIFNQGKNYFLTVMTDITPRKRAEVALRQTLRLQCLLAEISSAGVEPVEVERFLSESLALMGQVLDVSRAYIFEIDELASVTSNTCEWC